MNRKTAHSYSYLDQLTPEEVFQLLAGAAKKSRGEYLDRIDILFPGTAPFKFVTLEVPEPQESKGADREPESEVFFELIEAFKEMTGRRERFTNPGGESKGLLEGIARLLLKSTGEADETPADTGDNEYLVVSKSINSKIAENIFKNLSFHATSTRVSSVNDKEGGNRYIFHLKNDPQRKSSFSSLEAGGFFDPRICRVLKGYRIENRIIFFPAGIRPGEGKLSAFVRFLESAPVLFGMNEKRENTGPLAALVQWPSADETTGKTQKETADEIDLEFLYLGELKFYKQELFTERKVSLARFEYLHLQESKQGLERLAEEIGKAGADVGYRLELRPTQYLEKNRLERLLDRKARLDHNIAYLQSITVPQPVLLRFTHRNLNALASWIRSFPIHILHDGRLKYGFQATAEEPSGFHFILIDLRETSGDQLDILPLLQNRDIDITHIRFRLDPFWARHYFEAGGESLLFVPMGRAVFPPIHGWERGNMDRFLRETMDHWFHQRLKGRGIPAKPIYIFDGEPESKEPVKISILDQERMEPLHMKLGWINDNLMLSHNLEREGLISQMAKDTAWNEMSQKMKTEAEKSGEAYTETAREVSRQMAQTTNEMTRVLTNEIDRVVKETFRMTQKIKKMNQRMIEWDKVISDMDEVLKDVRQQQQEISFREGNAKNSFWRLEQQIVSEIQASERRRKDLEERIDMEIANMQKTARNLKYRLKRIKL